ncbi:M23 family metallopeptidase [candidate division WOR-3 bacterium]|nr:M23 family metallopeptidase [candidate division WOR-3 bacterium]
MNTRYSIIIALCAIFVACPSRGQKEAAPTRVEKTLVMKKGETLETVLDQDIDHRTTIAMIDVLNAAGFPFRYCLPGDSVTTVRVHDTLRQIVYKQNLMTVWFVMLDETQWSVAMKLPYIDTLCCLTKGVVNSTLYESMLKLKETPKLVYRFVDVFAWEIDFVTDTRNGDSFFVYYEKTFCDSTFVDYQNLIVMRYKGEVGDYYGFYYCDPDGNEDYYNKKGESLRKSLLKSPLKFSYISSYFSKSRYHPILKVWRPHHGLDYVAPKGTPVSSIGNGTVIFKGWKGGYGNLVEIKHMNNFKTRYGHLSAFAKGLYQGKKVKMGELIGYVGSTGLSTGPHLHFELHKDGVPINPLKVDIPRAPSVKQKYQALFEQTRDSLIRFLTVPDVPSDDTEAKGNT